MTVFLVPSIKKKSCCLLLAYHNTTLPNTSILRRTCSMLYSFVFFALHYAQLFMHISQIVRKQMNSTKRNEWNTWERAAAGRELMKIWIGNNITHRQTKCVRKRLSKTEENKNKQILSWIIQGQWGGAKQKKEQQCSFSFGTLFTQREVDKSSSLLMWNILIILFCYPTHFFFLFLALLSPPFLCVSFLFLFCYFASFGYHRQIVAISLLEPPPPAQIVAVPRVFQFILSSRYGILLISLCFTLLKFIDRCRQLSGKVFNSLL